jgi:hypothetical protein
MIDSHFSIFFHICEKHMTLGQQKNRDTVEQAKAIHPDLQQRSQFSPDNNQFSMGERRSL